MPKSEMLLELQQSKVSDKRKLNKIAKDHDKEITKLKKIMSDPNLRDDQKAIYAKRRRARMDIPSKY